MYPNIPPELELHETISNPLDQAEVIGFVGRNKMLGQPAIVIKGDGTFTNYPKNTVSIPDDHAESFTVDDAELVVLLEAIDEVRVMHGQDFERECHVTKHTSVDGFTERMAGVPIDSDQFRTFDRQAVEVGN